MPNPAVIQLWMILFVVCWIANLVFASEGGPLENSVSCGHEPINSANFQLFERIVQGQKCGHTQSCITQLECVLEQSYPKYDESAAEGLGRAGTYGEITPVGVSTLFDTMSTLGATLGSDDAFFDLGSGIGKMVLQSHLTTRVGSSIGIELDIVRHQQAVRAYNSLIAVAGTSANLPQVESSIGFVQGDILDTSVWANASVVYASVLCFPPDMLVKLSWLFADTLQPGAVVFSLMPLPGCHRGLWHIGSIDAQMTWTNKFEVHVYVVPPDPVSPPIWMSIDDETWEASKREMLAVSNEAKIDEYVSSALRQWDCSERVCTERATRRSFVSILVQKQKLKRIQKNNVDISAVLVWSDVLSAIMAKVRGHKKSAPDCLYEEIEATLVAEGGSQGPLCVQLMRSIANVSMVSGGTTALHALARSFSPTQMAANVLLESRADIHMIDQSGKTPLIYAGQFGHIETIKFMLSHRADVTVAANVSRTTPLHEAVRLSRRNAAYALLDAGADANAVDSSGKAPLHMVREGEERLVRSLVEHRADANLKDSHGKSPLHQAAGMGSTPLLTLFLEARADVNTVDRMGSRPLHGSVARSSIDAALILLDHNADVNARSNGGVTALAQAAMFGHARMVETLMRHRASPSIADSAGIQPLYYAKNSGHADLLEALQDGVKHAQEL